MSRCTDVVWLPVACTQWVPMSAAKCMMTSGAGCWVMMGLAEAGRQLEVGVEMDSIGWMYQGSRACCILYYCLLEIRMPENELRGPRRIRGIPAKASKHRNTIIKCPKRHGGRRLTACTLVLVAN